MDKILHNLTMEHQNAFIFERQLVLILAKKKKPFTLQKATFIGYIPLKN